MKKRVGEFLRSILSPRNLRDLKRIARLKFLLYVVLSLEFYSMLSDSHMSGSFRILSASPIIFHLFTRKRKFLLRVFVYPITFILITNYILGV